MTSYFNEFHEDIKGAIKWGQATFLITPVKSSLSPFIGA
jgi:hypothetical protein